MSNFKEVYDINEAEKYFHPLNKIEASFAPYADDIIDDDGLVVTEEAIRPEGANDRCFCCKQMVGEKHDKNCDSIRKVLRVSIAGYIKVSLPSTLNHVDTQDEAHAVCDDADAFLQNSFPESIGFKYLNSRLTVVDYEVQKLANLDEIMI